MPERAQEQTIERSLAGVDLINSALDAPAEEQLPTLVNAIQQLVPFAKVMLHGVSERTKEVLGVASDAWDQTALDSYFDVYHRHSPWIDVHVRAQADEIFLDTDHGVNLERNHPKFFKEWAQPHNLGAGAAIKLSNDYGIAASYSFHIPTAERTQLTAPLLEALNVYRGDLTRAYKLIAAELYAGVEKHISDSMFHGRTEPTMLVRADRTVLRRNAQAATMLQRGDIASTDPRERLKFADCSTQDLDALLAGARDTERADVHTLRKADPPHPARLLEIVPITADIASTWHGAPQAAFLLTVHAPETQAAKLCPKMIKNKFGLTRSEVPVIVAFCAGQTKKQIATEMGLKLVTIRNHIRNVRAKIGVRSEPAMISLLTGLARPRDDDEA